MIFIPNSKIYISSRVLDVMVNAIMVETKCARTRIAYPFLLHVHESISMTIVIIETLYYFVYWWVV